MARAWMRIAGPVTLLAAASALAGCGVGVSRADHVRHRHASRSQTAVANAYAQLPLSFAPGEPGSPARFVARGPGYSLFLTDAGDVLTLRRGHSHRLSVLRTTLAGAEPRRPVAEGRLPGVVNIYRGKTRREQLPTYARIRYASVYPGIDAVYHGQQGKVEYDFQVQPGADPGRIGLHLTGARSLRLQPGGDLLVRVPGGTLRQARPVAYQGRAGHRAPVAASFEVRGNTVRFRLGAYDRSKPLVIDPELSYATYLGGNLRDRFNTIAVASDGSVYVAGASSATNYPGAVARAIDDTDEDVVVTRVAADGKSLVFSDQFGGDIAASGYATGYETDEATDLVADSDGALVVGYTQTTDYPTTTTLNGMSCSGGGRSGFVTRIEANGLRGYSTCFGGNDNDTAESISVRAGDPAIAAYDWDIVGTTRSTDAWGSPTIDGFGSGTTPVGGGAYDTFAMEIQEQGTACSPCFTVRYRTFLHTSSAGHGVASDSTGIYFTGDTFASNLPVTAVSPAYGGAGDAYVGKVSLPPDGTSSSLSFLRYYGTSGTDYARAIALGSNAIYVVGSTDNSDANGLPSAVTTGNLTRGTNQDGYIAKFDTSGALSSSTYVGGDGSESLEDIAVQSSASGNAEYVIGTTDSASTGNSNGFTTRNGVDGQSCTSGDTQALVVKNIDGASPPGAIVACLGGSGSEGDNGNSELTSLGIAVSPTAADGTIYIAGSTYGGFPGVNGYQTTYGGSYYGDGFVAKLSQKTPSIDSGPSGVVLGNVPAQYTFSTTESGMHFSCSSPVAGKLVAGTRSESACPTPGSAAYPSLADGDQTFEVVSVDASGSESAPASKTFTVDKTPPSAFELTSPADGENVTTNFPTFSWTDSSDPHGVHYALIVDGQTVKTLEPSACSAGTCTAPAPAAIINGTHTWKVAASDDAQPANTMLTSARTFTVGNPPTARFVVSPNPALVGKSVTFDAATSNDAAHTITHYEWDLDGDGTFETDAGGNPITTKSYGVATTITVALHVTDSTGQSGTSTQQLRITQSQSESAQVGVTINKGAQYTNKPDVTLGIVAPPSATALLISNDGGFLDPFRSDVTSEVAWKLDSSGPERLPKTVYVRFLTGIFASPNFTDDIILDERPPVVQSASVAGPPAASALQTAALKKWTIKVRATDTNSGVGAVQVTANKRKPGKLLPYKTKLTVKSAVRPKFLRARDRAGNFSGWKKLR